MVCSLLCPHGLGLYSMVTPGRDYDFIAGEVLIIDKPLEWTSFDVVKRLRSTLTRRLGIKKFKAAYCFL